MRFHLTAACGALQRARDLARIVPNWLPSWNRIMQPNSEFFDRVYIRGVKVLRLNLPSLMDEGMVEQFSGALHRVTSGAGAGGESFALNFSGVPYLSSSGAGAFIRFVNQVKADGGRTVFCELKPAVGDLFKIMHLERLCPVVPTEADAVEKLAND
ncbi:STAS domain protein [Maioricimonas rarisocia]|uniref:STAS domain protein n=1 Tax=Maioricimonas rarisocia TaxID=2528026 RepID=A0A517Z891_9PLAN|nr:STAS domain-containing protein [Maioricimonas rarisocia]QDU38685.1 STAS domain protein [Maioricimonas rarisocia]